MVNKNNQILGHILALFTAIIWGTTLISTKILLKDFQPVEILFFRFLMALIVFYIIVLLQIHSTVKLNPSAENFAFSLYLERYLFIKFSIPSILELKEKYCPPQVSCKCSF